MQFARSTITFLCVVVHLIPPVALSFRAPQLQVRTYLIISVDVAVVIIYLDTYIVTVVKIRIG